MSPAVHGDPVEGLFTPSYFSFAPYQNASAYVQMITALIHPKDRPIFRLCLTPPFRACSTARVYLSSSSHSFPNDTTVRMAPRHSSTVAAAWPYHTCDSSACSCTDWTTKYKLTKSGGMPAATTTAMRQPMTRAAIQPAEVPASANIMFPNWSPNASEYFSMSSSICCGSEEVSCKSNQEISWAMTASKYCVRIFLACRSPNHVTQPIWRAPPTSCAKPTRPIL
mmetsp:Transcript_50385/g.133841  ORF Transcript_50385/g.133841 Transcript_50385/m.133841 type:complete len:224 (+) Transcript_50385:3451-4122(+)